MSVNHFDQNGINVLMHGMKHEAVIRLLLQSGADPLMQNQEGESAVSYAEKHYPERLPLFAEAIAADRFYKAIMTGDTAAVQEQQPATSQRVREIARFLVSISNMSNKTDMLTLIGECADIALSVAAVTELERRYLHETAAAKLADRFFKAVAAGDAATVRELQPATSQRVRDIAHFVAVAANQTDMIPLIGECTDLALSPEIVADLEQRYVAATNKFAVRA
jgi:hypothetical protein